jgi:poly(3-hydroxybutyrate) depolymerase
VILAPQGRRIGGKNRFDTVDPSNANHDLAAVDHFVQELSGEGVVDRRRIYALGDGSGSKMALFYSMARPAQVAAYGLYAPSVEGIEWACPGPPPPGWVGYRACDSVSPCPEVEQWLESSVAKGAAMTALRLDDGRRDEPSCDRSRRCKGQRADANHSRWPKEREGDLLDLLGRYSLELGP